MNNYTIVSVNEGWERYYGEDEDLSWSVQVEGEFEMLIISLYRNDVKSLYEYETVDSDVPVSLYGLNVESRIPCRIDELPMKLKIEIIGRR